MEKNEHGMGDRTASLALVEDDPFKRLAQQFFAKPGAVVKIPVGLENYSKRETKFNRGPNAVKHGMNQEIFCRCIICYSTINQCDANEKPNKPKNKSFDLLEFLRILASPLDNPQTHFNNLTSVSVLFEEAVKLVATTPSSCLCQLCSDACEQFLFQHRTISQLKRKVNEAHLKFLAAIRLSAELADRESKSGSDSETNVTSESISALNTVRKCLNKRKRYAPDGTVEDANFNNAQLRCDSPEPVRNCGSNSGMPDEVENYDELNNAIEIKKEVVDCNSISPEERNDGTALIITNITTLSSPPSLLPNPSENDSPPPSPPSPSENDSFEQYSSDTSSQDSSSDEDIKEKRNVEKKLVTRKKRKPSLDHHKQAKHQQNTVTVEPLECKYCSKMLATVTRLNRHIYLNHSNERHFACPHCPAKFSGSLGLKDHLSSKHPEPKRHACDLCPKTFVCRSVLMCHRRRHTDGGTYACPHCPAKFSENLELKAHLRSKHPQAKKAKTKRHACDLCPKKFCQQRDLIYHRRRHTDGRTFTCHHCPKTFYSPTGLAHHLFSCHPTADDEAQKLALKCNTCGTYYSCKAALAKHKRIFHGNGPALVCEHCGKRFATAHDMETHVRTHTNERPFKCHLCTSAFKDKYSLKLHIQGIHLKTGPHKCTQCNKCYIKKSDLLAHVKSHDKKD